MNVVFRISETHWTVSMMQKCPRHGERYTYHWLAWDIKNSHITRNPNFLFVSSDLMGLDNNWILVHGAAGEGCAVSELGL